MKKVIAHVHRFHGFAAVGFVGVDGETVYMTVEDAERLAAALRDCVSDIRTQPNFTNSEFGSVAFPLSNNGSRFNG